MNSGGPAFPQIAQMTIAGEVAITGMTLRQFYAGQALAGLCANTEVTKKGIPINGKQLLLEEASYKIADSMLAYEEKERDETKVSE